MGLKVTGRQDKARLIEAYEAMHRLSATFKQGDNRFGEFGKNCREAFDRHAAVVKAATGQQHSIYD